MPDVPERPSTDPPEAPKARRAPARSAPPVAALAALSAIDPGISGVLEGLRDGAALIHRGTRRILYANRALAAALGTPAEELTRVASFADLAAPLGYVGPSWSLNADGALPSRFEITLLAPNGVTIPMDVSVSPIDAEIAILIFRDMSSRERAAKALLTISDALERSLESQREELHRANEALEQALRVREEFVSIAAHELRTPLTPMLLRLESLRTAAESLEGTSGNAVRSGLEATLASARRLIGLTNRLLDADRLRERAFALDRAEVDLGAIVHEVALAMEEEAKRCGSVVAVSAPSIVGHWDGVRLEQVVSQLLVNALRYGAGKPIEVEATVDGGIARVSVKDHGPGIAQADQARIFERFERAAPVRHYGGFGLGLWVARTLVEAHGGRITVESRVGAGATFQVELPQDGTRGHDGD